MNGWVAARSAPVDLPRQVIAAELGGSDRGLVFRQSWGLSAAS